MTDQRSVFIGHNHGDDDDVKCLVGAAARHRMKVRNGSITSEKVNQAKNEQYIKNEILRPRIKWASTLVVVVSEQTKDSDYVNWKIEVAAEMSKWASPRIVEGFVLRVVDGLEVMLPWRRCLVRLVGRPAEKVQTQVKRPFRTRPWSSEPSLTVVKTGAFDRSATPPERTMPPPGSRPSISLNAAR